MQWSVPDGGHVEAQQLPVTVGWQVWFQHDPHAAERVLQYQEGLWPVLVWPFAQDMIHERLEALVRIVGGVLG